MKTILRLSFVRSLYTYLDFPADVDDPEPDLTRFLKVGGAIRDGSEIGPKLTEEELSTLLANEGVVIQPNPRDALSLWHVDKLILKADASVVYLDSIAERRT